MGRFLGSRIVGADTKEKDSPLRMCGIYKQIIAVSLMLCRGQMIYFVSDHTSRQLPFRASVFFVCIEDLACFTSPAQTRNFLKG